ncbi:hypothetical protein LTR91_011967 [Friedmanniomyces endolithicus]|uniref:Amino acid permease/ SLC12A domain-containing protein n=1 Tax=Friedmanniomyces endolithicus TaxID=329885 RepID=A0AAN6KGN6_9PEZI|nr:hypothetical protein LTR03_009114 [Friedmanniomyces endolithicus]KAK0911566.1 hypothetical protein LTR57_015273 [Friedmanniomyces endolithicus]KAK0960873.1 hypothetical protein LTS01_020685 [Friedmanniomyces endolithicus]KAK0981386.1 hypothetical protein LTR91_011967 [Friedmanniomyces endolithicus]KAK1076915.1 hypothetical protein LTR33_008533 [Friedmanniomyces endolithicus]
MSATAMQDMTKPEERLSISEYGNDDKPGVAPKGGTAFDEQEMRRMGKVQELRRNFKFIGIVGFVTILQATWESTLLANSFGLVNGGTGGVIWCTIAVWLLMLCMIASMAEMASMCPTAGGWCCCLGWIAGIPSCGIQLAGVVQAMVLLVNPNADVGTLWQSTLLVFLFVLLTVGFNVFFAHHLPLAEGIVLFLHVFAFFAFLLTLWIMADHAPAVQVFTTFK